jgi:hypothetical protein
VTSPLSSSATRRFTSVTQAASASSSTSVPRLSSNEPASAARASVGSARVRVVISLPGDELESRKAKIERGTADSGAPFPPARAEFTRRDTRTNVRRSVCSAIEKSLSALHFVRCHRTAFCAARVSVPARVGVTVGSKWGVSDPGSPAPFFAPGPVHEGSLTPHLHVSFVRLANASSRSCAASGRVPVRCQVSTATCVL